MQQYAYRELDCTIHSSGQLEHYKNIIEDWLMKCGGKQCIHTHDGYIIPLDIINGLPYMKMSPNPKQDLKDYTSVILTNGSPWDPTILDNVITDEENWYEIFKEFDRG